MTVIDGECETAQEVQSALLEDLPPARQDEVSEFIMSSLAISGRTGFTEQDLANEQAGLTNEERAAALSDIFGKLCELNHHGKEKKAKRDLCQDSISFLVKQMRMELERDTGEGKDCTFGSAEEMSKGRV